MRKRTYTRGYIEASDGSYIEVADPYATNAGDRGGIRVEIETADDTRYGVMVGLVSINGPAWQLEELCENDKQWNTTVGGFLVDKGYMLAHRMITDDKDRLYFQAYRPLDASEAYRATDRILG